VSCNTVNHTLASLDGPESFVWLWRRGLVGDKRICIALTNKELKKGKYILKMVRIGRLWDIATSNISLYAEKSSLDSFSMALKL
jgi:hypothetical protein